MSNGAKITIVVAIVLALGVTIYGVTNSKKDNKKVVNDTSSDMMQFFNEYENTSSGDSDNNEVLNNVNNESIENVVTQSKNNVVSSSNSNTDKVIGKEEQESSNENTGLNDEQTAIDLAKKEWGISVDSYDYSAELQDDGTYIVRVIGKNDRNEVTRYKVNIKTGAVTEVQ